MKKLISARAAGNLLLIALGMLAIFHILVLFNLVPSTIIWGGRVGETPADLFTLEILALLVTAIFAAIVAAKVGYILPGRSNLAVTIGLWIIFAYLLLNTIGNLLAGATFEKVVFTPITLILAFCALRLALEP
jgi:hypothetical protein